MTITDQNCFLKWEKVLPHYHKITQFSLCLTFLELVAEVSIQGSLIKGDEMVDGL